MVNLERSHSELQDFLNSQAEWLLIHGDGKTFSLQNSEIEIEIKNEKILLGFPCEKGFQIWRITDYKIENEKITFNLTRNFGIENEKIKFVSRISAANLNDTIELARLEKANRVADLIRKDQAKSKLVRVQLNKENGRLAQMIFEKSNGAQIAALADVSDAASPENLLVFAILWLKKLGERKKKPIYEIWILAEKKQSKILRKLHALLSANWKGKIKIFGISRKDAKAQREAELIEVSSLRISDLWREKPGKIQLSENARISRTAREIIKFAPGKIDVLFGKHGETLRFSGLPFARVRKIFDEEKVWFGIEKDRQILSGKTQEDFRKLLNDLEIYRHFDAPNKRHAFYRLAPEAWLEAILRNNIKLLDANLILSPIYNQFRTARDKIDLLALRKDGRLVIIELKVAPDREMIFQAADYWRKIELQRRKGNLQKARIFGDLEIKDEPALVYLVAPTMSFHWDFKFLAGTISQEIEIYRFDLNENWRESLKVLKRERI